MSRRILVIDDEQGIRDALSQLLEYEGYEVRTEASGNAGLVAYEQFRPQLVFLDVKMAGLDGLETLRRLRTQDPAAVVVMISGHATIQNAVEATQGGAYDIMEKPLDTDRILVTLRNAIGHLTLREENERLREVVQQKYEIVGRSYAIRALIETIDRVAGTEARVLITGENGTGKEMVARELYRRSPRRQNPFIKVNCAAISENLIESEFFGHERGAFTGATDRREGRFELAHQGTLLLDEVSEIPANLQAKLLRVLQEREFERVGGNRTIKVNVRIIATSNRDLISYVEKGQFRQDLYYRLNVFPVHVPALRERGDDILPLAGHFLARFARRFGVKVTGFSDSAQGAMLAYRWPGNVRELQNTIERAVILTEAGHPVSAAALGLPLVGQASSSAGESLLNASQPFDFEPQAVAVAEPEPLPASAASLTRADGTVLTIAELEKQAIANALVQTEGNRTKAADLLGISIRTLRNKLQEYRDAGAPIETPVGTD